MKLNKSIGYMGMLVMVLITSCKNNRLDVDISTLKEEPVIYRFEDEMFGTPKEEWAAQMAKIRQRDPQFYDVYAYEFTYRNHFHDMGWGTYNDADSIYDFTQNEFIRKIYTDVKKQYGNFEPYKEQLAKAIRYFHYHFPKLSVPAFTTMITELSTRVAPFEKCVGVSLDFFMGSDYGAYELMSRDGRLTQYQLRRMSKEYLVPAMVQGLYEFYFQPRTHNKTFLAQMLEEGKRQYFADALMPFVPDTIKREYTGQQLKWCEDNQVQMWSHFTQYKLFFSTDVMAYSRYFEDGPFTSAPDVPHESSPRLAMYAGWQIIRHYMDENPEVTLEQLMQETDYEKILKLSGYKPR